jgi:hypothetical protein
VNRRHDLALIASVLVIVLAGCASTPPSGSPGPASSGASGAAVEPVVASAERDGVVVTLRASADRVVAGQPIQFRVDVRNAGAGKVSWQSGGCELLNGFAIDGPPVPQPPEGAGWPDASGLAKWSATTGGVALEAVRSPNVPEGVAFGCPADLRYEDIDPGETISADAVWSGRTSDGVPAPPGAYRLTYGFPFLGRLPADQLGPDPPAAQPIGVALPVVLEGEAFDGLPSTLAIDAAFSDPRVAAWVNDYLAKERLGGAEIRLVDGRWRFTIHLVDDRSTVVFVDPSTGRVEGVQLAD